MTWVEYFQELSPTWLKGTWGDRFVGAVFGLKFDSLADWGRFAVKAPLLNQPEYPADALPYTGAESNMPGYATELPAAYKARLQDRWNLWLRGGNEYAITHQLELFGFPDAEIKTPLNWSRYPVNYWSQFWVYVPFGSHSFTAPEDYGDGQLFGDGTHYGIGNITDAEVTGLRALVESFRPAHVICRGYVFSLEADPPYYGDPISYGDPGLTYGVEEAEIDIP